MTARNGIYEIRLIDLNDNGTYICVAENSIGNASLTYNVLVVGTAKIFSTSPNLTIIDTASKLSLHCSASGIPTPVISWTRNGNILRTSSKYYLLPKTLTNGSHELELELKNVSQHDKGTYNCVAINALGMDMKSIHLEVLCMLFTYHVLALTKNISFSATPKFKLNDSPGLSTGVSTMSGLPILLTCSSVYANPKPSLNWWKNNLQLSDDDNIKIINSGKMLTILSSSGTDNGIYECCFQFSG